MKGIWTLYVVLLSQLLVLGGQAQESNIPIGNGNCPGGPNCNLGRPQPPPIDPRSRFILGKRERYKCESPLTERVELRILVSSKNNLTSPTNRPSLAPENDFKVSASVPDIIEAEGYIYKEHFVKTQDGYILRVFRISKKGCQFDSKKFPVFLQHGFLGTAADWLIVDGDRALPFLLVDTGNDVWLGNSRGNEYSKNHTHLDPNTFFGPFWNFSFHEMGREDLPAVFDYILKETGRPKLNYIGHSMGTTMFYVALSYHPKYNNKIHKSMQLAPAAFLYRMTSLAKQLLKPVTKFYMGVKSQLNAVLTPPFLNYFLRSTFPQLCPHLRPMNRSLCEAGIFFIAGENSADTNLTVIQRALGHFPSTTSLKTLVHFLQLTQNQGFRWFDYGPAMNLKTYGQVIPPKYRLFRVNPLTLNIYGFRDILIDREDSEQTTAQLGSTNERINYLVYDYNHVDFIWGDRAAISVNLILAAFIEEKVVESGGGGGGSLNRATDTCDRNKPPADDSNQPVFSY